MKSPPPHWWVKIGDFGITKRVSNEQTALRTEIGSRRFQAPEVAGITGDCGDYSNSVDIWSLGCVIHKVLTGAVPFDGITALESYCSSRTEFPESELRDRGVSDDGVTFLKRLLAVKPEGRPTAVVAAEDQWLDVVEEDVDKIEELGVETTDEAAVGGADSAPEEEARDLEELDAQGPDRTFPVVDPTLSLSHVPAIIEETRADTTNQIAVDKTRSPPEEGAKYAEELWTQGQHRISPVVALTPSLAHATETTESAPTAVRLYGDSSLALPPALSSGSELAPIQFVSDPDHPLYTNPHHTPLSRLLQLQGTYYADVLSECNKFTSDPPTNSKTRDSEFSRLSEKIELEIIRRLDKIEPGYDVRATVVKRDMMEQMEKMLTKMDKAARVPTTKLFPNPSRMPSSDLQDLISRYCEDPFSVAPHEREKVLAWTGWPQPSDMALQRATSTELTRDNPIQLLQKSARPTPSLEHLISLYCESSSSIASHERERVLAYTGWPEPIDEQNSELFNSVGQQTQVRTVNNPVEREWTVTPTPSVEEIMYTKSKYISPEERRKVLTWYLLESCSTPSTKPTRSLQHLFQAFSLDSLSVSTHDQDRVLNWAGWPADAAEHYKRKVLGDPVPWRSIRWRSLTGLERKSLPDSSSLPPLSSPYGHSETDSEGDEPPPNPPPKPKQRSLQISRLPTPSLENLIMKYCDNPMNLLPRERQRVLIWTRWLPSMDLLPYSSLYQEGVLPPAASETSNFTSVSQRGVNPGWGPPQGMVPMRKSPNRDRDMVLGNNSDFPDVTEATRTQSYYKRKQRQPGLLDSWRSKLGL